MQHLTKLRDQLRKLHPVLRTQHGAIDLASIMTGVIVIGVIAGVIAATVFAVVPWSQDAAAKSALDSVRTAQSAAVATSAESGAGQYSNLAQLVSSNLIQQPAAAVTVNTDAAGTCYVATSTSSSGKQFWADSTGPTVTAGAPASTCVVAAGQMLNEVARDADGNRMFTITGGPTTAGTFLVVRFFTNPELVWVSPEVLPWLNSLHAAPGGALRAFAGSFAPGVTYYGHVYLAYLDGSAPDEIVPGNTLVITG